jgi:hypothetical protein
MERCTSILLLTTIAVAGVGVTRDADACSQANCCSSDTTPCASWQNTLTGGTAIVGETTNGYGVQGFTDEVGGVGVNGNTSDGSGVVGYDSSGVSDS